MRMEMNEIRYLETDEGRLRGGGGVTPSPSPYNMPSSVMALPLSD